ncbi:unnamed protein product [Owenia fusiformis]|uniref:Exportin-T n=1 Tax=Owenia fusiformis TaxID=6347 RepID=A0A8S4NRE2_OWEFU|nr:unnamed protein product [Owenia fusiformis]
MDEEALLGLLPTADIYRRTRATQYFEQLKESSNGWEICAGALASGQYMGNDHVRFFLLQVVENYLKARYPQSDEATQQKVKTLIISLLQQQGVDSCVEKSFIRNKIAQLFSLVYVADYPHRWPTFIQDILQGLTLGVNAIDLYLKVLMAIDSEVVDRDISHTQQETQRNTLIKDTMREQCVPQMVESWYHIITSYQNSKPEVVCACLDVIGAYVSWIDIGHIANDKFVSVLLQFMSVDVLRESACDCIIEIISKGMDPLAKMNLIESFTSILDRAGILNPGKDEDPDYLAKLARLVDSIGTNLIINYQKMSKSSNKENADLMLQSIENKVQFIFRFLCDEDDDVSGAVANFTHDYISVLKQAGPLTAKQKENIGSILMAVISKMKLDESYNFDQEGEDEAMFQEYRKQLKVIYQNIGQLEPDLVVTTTHQFVENVFKAWKKTNDVKYADLELGVLLLYQVAEVFPVSHGQHFSGDMSKVSSLQQMMRLMIECNVCGCRHIAVQLQYFETVVRYEKFFQHETQHILPVLTAFLDERGLRNPSAKVCSRAAYLFSRFVKAVRSHLQEYIEDILKRMTDMLTVNSPDNGFNHRLSSEDQFFIYETAGILIISSNLPVQKKQELMKSLLAPIVSKFSDLYTSMCNDQDEKRQEAYAESLNHAMAFASRSSKGFSNNQTMKVCGCVEVYTETLQVFLQALNTPVHRSLLQTGVRQYLHRMVVCLEAEILPFIPLAMEQLLKHADAKEIYDFIPLMNQVVMKFKQLIVPFLQQVFLPLVQTIFTTLSAPSDERDTQATNEKKMLRRGYFSFVSTIVSNNVAEVLSSLESDNLTRVLRTIIEGATEIPDPTAQKSCYNILKRLVELWGGETGLNGFDDYIYKSIVPCCFLGPSKPTFDLNDGQTVLALGESALCMRAILAKLGEQFCVFLLTDYLPKLNVSSQLAAEYCQALKSDNKTFKAYTKTFFTRVRS